MKGANSQNPLKLGKVPVIGMEMTLPFEMVEVFMELSTLPPGSGDEIDKQIKQFVTQDAQKSAQAIVDTLMKSKAKPAKTPEENKCVVAIDFYVQFEPETALHIVSLKYYSILPMEETDKIMSSLTTSAQWLRKITKDIKTSK